MYFGCRVWAGNGEQTTGSMPARACGQLAALDQHYITPAVFREVIQHRATDDTAADDNDPGACLHLLLSSFAVKEAKVSTPQLMSFSINLAALLALRARMAFATWVCSICHSFGIF